MLTYNSLLKNQETITKYLIKIKLLNKNFSVIYQKIFIKFKKIYFFKTRTSVNRVKIIKSFLKFNTSRMLPLLTIYKNFRWRKNFYSEEHFYNFNFQKCVVFTTSTSYSQFWILRINEKIDILISSTIYGTSIQHLTIRKWVNIRTLSRPKKLTTKKKN